jgi:hypothetical protein
LTKRRTNSPNLECEINFLKTRRQKKLIASKLLIFGSEPFAYKTFLFLKSFSRDVSYLGTIPKKGILKLIRFFEWVMLLSKVEFIYTIGYFKPDSIYYLIARLLRKKIIVHWIGSEILDLKKSHYWPVHVGFSVTRKLLHELDLHSINSNYLPLFFSIGSAKEYNKQVYPNSHGVLFYLVAGKEQFYGLEYLMLLADAFGETPFYVIGSSKISFQNDNIYSVGYLDEDSLNELFRKITIYVRITQHDGLSQLILKSLSLGRVVVSNTQYPFVTFYNPSEDSCSKLIESLMVFLSKKPMINNDSINYIDEHYGYSKQILRYKSAFNEVGIKL